MRVRQAERERKREESKGKVPNSKDDDKKEQSSTVRKI